MKYVVFDTETSGLPICAGYGLWPDPTDTPRYDRARLLELAWVELDENFNETARHAFLVSPPEGVDLESHGGMAFNGITRAELVAEGRPLGEVLDLFGEAIGPCNAGPSELGPTRPVLVAHNIGFDVGVVAAEMVRTGRPWQSFVALPKVCTMEQGKPLTRIQRFGGWKDPKLSELCTHFGVTLEGAHRALNDVLACAECFRRIKVQK